MIRRLAVLALALLTYLVVRRLTLRARAGRAERQARGPETMVRDRVCETFLPRARALTVKRSGEVHFFCSTACRDAFLAGRLQP